MQAALSVSDNKRGGEQGYEDYGSETGKDLRAASCAV